MILYINACVRRDSRTDRLARKLLETLPGPREELCLEEVKPAPLDRETLEKRVGLIEAGRFEEPMFALSRQFAAADSIVIAAPFWDNSFPAILKAYLENIYVVGLVSEYGPDGIPRGLCRAKKLYYVTTAGGPYCPDFSYTYLRELAVHAFGIPETELIFTENLDIAGNDPEAIVDEVIRSRGWQP